MSWVEFRVTNTNAVLFGLLHTALFQGVMLAQMAAAQHGTSPDAFSTPEGKRALIEYVVDDLVRRFGENNPARADMEAMRDQLVEMAVNWEGKGPGGGPHLKLVK